MVKAVVLDIDGVIIGNLPGVNFPYPSKKVSDILHKIHLGGIPVSFLTGKTTFAAKKNISKLGIDNPHIADGGAVIFNPIQGNIIRKEILKKDEIRKLLNKFNANYYLNLFTTENYYMLNHNKNEYSNIYAKFIGKDPVIVNDFEDLINKEEISKINISSFDVKQKNEIDEILKSIKDIVNYSWSRGPNTGNVETAVVTSKNASKKQGVKYLADYLKVDMENVLGVGDTIHDWDFIEICGYKGVMGNGTEELKEKLDKTDQRHFIGGHINEDGIIDIFKKFNLI